jgi:hypothetical protein
MAAFLVACKYLYHQKWNSATPKVEFMEKPKNRGFMALSV